MSHESFLANLNSEQQTAVTHRDGPLLIIAGAGTGKTTVITRRIAWLIAEKLAAPGEILALTFTEKAAGEMESRIDQLLPYGYTDTTIATFHAFGDQLLREHSLDLDLPPEFRVLSSDEQELFLTERLDTIDNLLELRPVTNPGKYIHHILKVISRAKDELVGPAAYAAAAKQLLATATDDEAKRAARRQIDIATIYQAYEDLKAQEGVIDFGDQIMKLVSFLDREPGIRTKLQNTYRYILVDEFQDTNIAQFALVQRLLGDERNITVVGDDDQAIYKFRGAAVANILSFLTEYPDATKVVLSRNYRSTQKILDTAHTLIQGNNPDRLEATLGIEKRLIGTTEGTLPVFHWYSHDVDELDALVELIRVEHKHRPLNEIAVLVRTNALLAPIAAALHRADIPYTASSDHGFIHKPEVRGVIAFFTALLHPLDSLAYMKLAFSPFYQLDPVWILQINDAAKHDKREFSEILEDKHHIAWERMPPEGQTRVAEFRDSIASYRQLVGIKTPGELLYQFLKERGVLHAAPSAKSAANSGAIGQLSLFSDYTEGEQLTLIQNLAAVFEAIKRYEAAGRDPFVPRFVEHLDELLGHVTPPTVDLGPDVPAVQLMTVHAAKGLEFDVVILPNFTADRFPARRKHEPLTLPDSLIAETLPTGDEHLEEERRLAYVAMTRARRQLYLSGAAKSGEGTRTKKPSPFIAEALSSAETANPIERVNSADRIHQFAPTAITPVPTKLRMPTHDGLLFLSPAMIETYTNDPYQFYWRYVLNAPQPASHHLSYGNAIHAAIECYHRLRLNGQHPTPDDLLKRYDEAWSSEGFASRADEDRLRAHGRETLRRFFVRAEKGTAPSHIEETVTLHVPGARIRGRIDAIYAERGEIRDFKTSEVKDDKDAAKKIKDNIPIKIYALAYQKRFGKLPERLVLDFVEKDLEATLIPTPEIIAATDEIIAAAVAGIHAGQFDPNPNNAFKDYD